MIVCKYKFDKSIYENLIPIFNDGYTGYTISDEIDSENSNHVIRTIECDSLSTRIDFGVGGNAEQYTNRSDSLLAIYNLDTSAVTDGSRMVKGCRYMTEINTSDWDTSNMVDMSGMFGYCTNLTNISCEWNTSNVTNMNNMFRECKSLTSLDVSNFDTSNVTNMNSMFYGCTNLTSLDVSNWDTSNVTNMNFMFNTCSNLTQLDVSNFDTSKVTAMSYMFRGCNNLTLLDISNFNTSKVIAMNNMFYDCTKLTSLDVSNFDTSNVTNMNSMFQDCTKLTSLDVSNWNTSNVTNMQSMFYGCKNLTTLDVSNWNTSNVTTMYYMFNNCYKLTTLDVSNFDTSNVTTMLNMFNNCYELTSLDVSNFDTSNVTDMRSVFWKCTKLKSLILSNWNFSKVTSMGSIFSTNANVKMSLEMLDIANWEISDSTSASNLFYNEGSESLASIKNIRCNNTNVINNVLLPNIPTRSSDNKGQIITSATLTQETINTLASKNWTVVSSDTLTKVAEYVYNSNTWNSMIPTFNSEFIEYFIDDVEDENGLVTRTISSLGELPTSMIFGSSIDWDIGKTDKSSSLLEVLDIDTSGLTTMHSLFRWCNNLTSVNCDNWNTSNITNMKGVFTDCQKLTSLDVSNWDTSNVTDMIYLFNDCYNLTSLDVSNFDTSNVTRMRNMFSGCHKLTSLDVSNFNTSKVTDMSWMFYNTPLLTDIGMLYCSPSTINTIASNLPTTHTQTIWVKDTKPSECTVVSGVEFKEYKDNSVMINLSSPLLDGDRIEVKDGKLCHYHKMKSIVLDGSENWKKYGNSAENTTRFFMQYPSVISEPYRTIKNFIPSTLPTINNIASDIEGINIYTGDDTKVGNIRVRLNNQKLSTQDANGFKQWLSENPTTIVYELINPYYEDITPLQSDIALETYLESNLDIYTDLPIKTNLTYLTNIANTSSIEEEINAINEGTDLTNLLEDEINN